MRPVLNFGKVFYHMYFNYGRGVDGWMICLMGGIGVVRDEIGKN